MKNFNSGIFFMLYLVAKKKKSRNVAFCINFIQGEEGREDFGKRKT